MIISATKIKISGAGTAYPSGTP